MFDSGPKEARIHNLCFIFERLIIAIALVQQSCDINPIFTGWPASQLGHFPLCWVYLPTCAQNLLMLSGWFSQTEDWYNDKAGLQEEDVVEIMGEGELNKFARRAAD